MNILRVARVPAITIQPDATVFEGIELMQRENVGSLFVVEDDRLEGVLTERDIMLRIAVRHRDPEITPIREVMTSKVWTLSANATVNEAIRMMLARRIRHLPITRDGKVEGMVSIRHMLREHVANLTQKIDTLVAESCADGIGG